MGDSVLEFGLRRAQGFDGAISAARASYIGGVHATSNVLAGKLLDIPIKGTHAHAWVMMFDSEPEAFEAYANAMPNNCVFLVDTYDTIKGVQNAIQAGTDCVNMGMRWLVSDWIQEIYSTQYRRSSIARQFRISQMPKSWLQILSTNIALPTQSRGSTNRYLGSRHQSCHSSRSTCPRWSL